MTAESRARLALALAAALLAAAVFGFFRNLSTAATDYSQGDSAYFLQVWHNFVSGRPLQTSIYHNPANGVAFNPEPYASQTIVHANFTPFVFVPVFALKPDLYGFYALMILVVMASTVAAAAGTFRDICPPGEERSARLMVALAAVLVSSLFRLAHYKGHMLLYATPFFLAMDAFARRRNAAAFLAFAVLTALVSEDAAMLVVSYSAYRWLCDRDLRLPAAAAAVLGALILLAMALVIMPAARHGLALKQSSHVGHILSDPAQFWVAIRQFPREARIGLLFVPALAAARLAFDPGPRSGDLRLLALVLVAPGAHWLITMLTYGAHHLVPPLVCMILALALLLADGRPALGSPMRRRAAAACAAVFLGVSVWNLSRDFPLPLGPGERAESAANLSFIREVRARVPQEATLVFWANQSTAAFLADRPSLWRFPDFHDRAEYVAVQPGARRSWATDYASGSGESYEAPIPDESLARLRRDLASAGPYQVAYEGPELLLLQRRTVVPFAAPATAVGFGYLKNLGKLL